MTVVAINPDYRGEAADAEEKFHGNRLLYVGWEDHLLFCSPICLSLPASMPFGALTSEVLPGIYGSHPDFGKIDWSQAEWFDSGAPFNPDPAKSLADNGLVHKSVLRLCTPGLTGIAGSGS